MFCEILACVVGCMMEGNFPNGSAGSATSFSEKACSYLESKSKVWPDGYSQVRPFDDAIKLARQVSLVGRDASTNQVKEILGVPNVVRQRAGKQRNDIRGLDFRYWLRKKDSRTVNVNDEDLTLRFDNLGVVQQMEFAKGTNVLIYVFPRNVVNVESWKSNVTGSFSFLCAPSPNNLLIIRVRDDKGSERCVETRASCCQKFDASWIDESTILVASSDIGFIAINVTGNCLPMTADVLKMEGDKYLVRILNDNREQIQAIAVEHAAMPETNMLKHLNHVADGE